MRDESDSMCGPSPAPSAYRQSMRDARWAAKLAGAPDVNTKLYYLRAVLTATEKQALRSTRRDEILELVNNARLDAIEQIVAMADQIGERADDLH